jgi:hypothetical protein
MRDTGPVDAFTLAHIAIGYGVGRLGMDWRAAIGLAIAYEAVEDALLDGMPWIFPRSRPESKLNAIVDIGVFLGGFAAATYHQERIGP